MQQRVMDGLGETEPCRLTGEFQAGATVGELAERFAMSQSTVKGSCVSEGYESPPPSASMFERWASQASCRGCTRLRDLVPTSRWSVQVKHAPERACAQ